ncbi:hypothetical protein KR038_004287 [Drosophila bunnanda]|nr:hypothetical protein KR038_004287 [Drosophila bunnanda]
MSSECSSTSNAFQPPPKCQTPAKQCCKSDPCKPDERPPFARSMPEDRRLALIISNEDPSCCIVTSETIMAQIFKVVEATVTPKLRFSECVPMAQFCGRMVIVCEDECTLNWLICVVNTMCQPHSAIPFIQFFCLIPASTILPVTEYRESSCDIFDFLEKQNEGIITHKWVVMRRYALDPCVCTDPMPSQNIFENEILELYMDEESKDLIESTCSKLKYQFWTIEFKFD